MLYNYEMHKSFNLTARVSDGSLYGTGQIIVSILDMNEPPVLSSNEPLNISEVDSMHLFPNKNKLCRALPAAEPPAAEPPMRGKVNFVLLVC